MNIFDAVGNTPLIKLNHLSPREEVEIYVKAEYYNPTGSIKDRIVKYIIEDAEANGVLQPGATIVENTSGNTGAAVAFLSAAKGYKAILVMPDKVSIEKQNTLTALGAKIVVTPTSVPPDHPDHYVNTTQRIAKETPNCFQIDQYNNLKNPAAHYRSTGPEIWQQTKGKITHFVASGSTGGTVSGIGRYLKEKNRTIEVTLVDPVGSIYYEYFQTGKETTSICDYLVEGVGEDHIPGAIDFGLIDRMYQFSDQDAFLTARKLAQVEGIFGGGTGGANVWGALQLAGQIEGPAVIATVIPDSGLKYLSKLYNDDWMREKGFIL